MGTPHHSGLAPLVFLLLSLASGAGCAARERADFVAVIRSEVETLDPAAMTGVWEGTVGRALYEGLLSPGPRGPEPGIAERFEISADGLVYTFRLRGDLRFSDGSPLTSVDVARSWVRVLDPRTAANNSALLDPIAGARAFREEPRALGDAPAEAALGIATPDARTIVVTLERPMPAFADLLCLPPFYPVHLSSIAAHPDDWQEPGNLVTNGPYVLEFWRVNDRMRLRRNPFYRERDRAAFETLDFLAVASTTTAFNLYETGAADWLSFVPRDVLPDLRGRSDLRIAPYLGVTFYRVNVSRKPFDDPRVRRALSLAADRERIVRYVTRAGEAASRTLVPDLLDGYSIGLEPGGPSHDPEAARALLSEAGFGPGSKPLEVEILYSSADVNRDVAVALEDQWSRALGARVSLRNQEWKVYLQTCRSLDYDLARSSWIADYPDPESFLSIFRSGDPNNRTGWASPRYDSLLDAASRDADRGSRYRTLALAERLLLEEGPVIPLYSMVSTNLVRPGIAGFEAHPLDLHLPHRFRRVAP